MRIGGSIWFRVGLKPIVGEIYIKKQGITPLKWNRSRFVFYYRVIKHCLLIGKFCIFDYCARNKQLEISIRMEESTR